MKDRLQGKFIVLDGPDGCGKSTQAGLLVKWLEGEGVSTSRFRDPGDTSIGEKIREILLNPEHLAMDTRTELLLYMAARAQLWAEKIAPALQNNRCVVLVFCAGLLVDRRLHERVADVNARRQPQLHKT